MRNLVAACVLSLLPVACGGNIETGYDRIPADQINEHYSALAFEVAHDSILKTRPQSTDLLLQHLNMVLANNSILDTMVNSVEDRMLTPLTNGVAQLACPYLTKAGTGSSISCRYLVDQALEDATLSSGSLLSEMEQEVASSHDGALVADELSWVNTWIQEAVISGIDAGSVHTVEILRTQQVCDQSPSHQESAFGLGEAQGKALLEQAEATVLPTVPKSQCNTDVIASTVRAQAQSMIEQFAQEHALCAGFAPADLAEDVDLALAEASRREGMQEGVREAYEALRVRLVSTWACEACQCFVDRHGKGDVYCFATGDLDRAQFKGENGLVGEFAEANPEMVVPRASCSASPVPVGSPLVVDLDGDGVHLAAQRVSFDLADTGEPARIQSLVGADAFLALDHDGDGQISSGAELFGNASWCGSDRCSDGVQALAQHDQNGDGQLDDRDPVFARLLLWRDDNRDGRSQPGELRGLAEAGVRAIRLQARLDGAWTDAAGNSALRAVTFERTDGSLGTIPDVWFSLSFDRLPRNPRSAGIPSTFSR